VDTEVTDMLRLGVIKPTRSPWNSPVVIVKKKCGAIRFCVDFRKLNEVTVKDPYGMPTIDELRDRVEQARFYSNVDLTKAYWNVAMAPEDSAKTAFTAGRGHFQFVRMPFGLKNAPATFQRAIDTILRGLPNTVAYLDDILVFSADAASHQRHLRALFERLQQAGLKINKAKSSFGRSQVKFLGHDVSAAGVALSPENLTAVAQMRAPTTKKELERFLGLANYFSKFVHNLADVAAPLFQLKRRHARNFAWLPAHETSFQALKTALTQAPVLLTPLPGKPFYVLTDASDVALGASLEQDVAHGRRPVAFASRLLTPVERRRPVIDREALAILWACEKFRPYLLGSQFYIDTDHEPLKWLYRSPQVKGRLAHWQLRLAEYDGLQDVRYIPGAQNVIADLLSRPPGGDLPVQPNDPGLWEELQRQDPTCTAAMPSVNGIVRCEGQLFLPIPLRPQALASAHGGPEGLHFGPAKTAALLRRTVDWPGLNTDVDDFIRACHHCAVARAARQPRQPLRLHPDPGIPNNTWAGDFFGPLPRSARGHRYVFLAVDVTSRFLAAVPLPHTTSAHAIAALTSMFHEHGVPHVLLVDNGRMFTSRPFSRFCKRHGVRLTHSTPYRPTGNAFAERAVRTIKEQLRSWASQFPGRISDWDLQLFRIVQAYNHLPHSATRLPPATVRAMDPTAPSFADVVRTSAATRASKLPVSTSRSAEPLAPGTWVLRSRGFRSASDPRAALQPVWDGPFRILRARGPIYQLADVARPHRRCTLHRDLIRPYNAVLPSGGGTVGENPLKGVTHSFYLSGGFCEYGNAGGQAHD
jgi:transposase InsO family protein